MIKLRFDLMPFTFYWSVTVRSRLLDCLLEDAHCQTPFPMTTIPIML